MTGYSELYLNDARKNLGEMIEYAVVDLGYEPDEFLDYFITSGIADKFGKGNPKYTVGMSGTELAECVLKAVGFWLIINGKQADDLKILSMTVLPSQRFSQCTFYTKLTKANLQKQSKAKIKTGSNKKGERFYTVRACQRKRHLSAYDTVVRTKAKRYPQSSGRYCACTL